VDTLELNAGGVVEVVVVGAVVVGVVVGTVVGAGGVDVEVAAGCAVVVAVVVAVTDCPGPAEHPASSAVNTSTRETGSQPLGRTQISVRPPSTASTCPVM
jgi:hypothetical protein